MDQPLLWAGTLACALAAAAGLLLPDRSRGWALLIALLIAPGLVIGDNWDSERVADLRDSPLLVGAVVAVTLAAIATLARLFRSHPFLIPILAIAALPFRIPIELGDEAANLLLPLYAVILAAVLAQLLGRGELGPNHGVESPGRFVAPLLAGVLVLYAAQSAYADDISAATENIAFFMAPFAALFVILRGVEWDRSLLRMTAVIVVAEALLFSLVGFGQYAVGELFWNEKVIAGNEAHAWFRVNSLFWDPNILGRYLAVTMVFVAAAIVWARSSRTLLYATGLFALLLLAETITFSQSSMIALLAGLVVLALARWGVARAAAVLAITAAGVAAAWVLFAGGGIEVETSGRESLIRGGIELAEDRPLVGQGSGSFSAVFREEFGGAGGVAVASHTEPITVVAEQGAIGLIAYIALILGTFWAAAVRAGLRPPGVRGLIGSALLAAYAAMFVHSLGYATFLIDPITWILLALISSTSIATAWSPDEDPHTDAPRSGPRRPPQEAVASGGLSGARPPEA